MNYRLRSVLSFAVALLLTGSVYGQKLPNIDALSARQKVPGNDVALAKKAQGLAKPGTRIETESRFGVPTFVWAAADGTASISVNAPKANGLERAEVAAARAHLSQYASLYQLGGEDVGNAVVSMVQNSGKGPVVVKFRSELNGIEIFREELNVLMNSKLENVAISGYISSRATPGARGSLSFALSAQSAAVNAVRDMTGASVASSHLTPAGSRDGYDFFSVASASGAVLDEPVRLKKVYFHLPEGLEPAYYIEVIGQDGISTDTVSADGPVATTGGYAYVISATDGSILFRKDLVSDASTAQQGSNLVNTGTAPYTYRVWADPVTGIPYDTPAGNAVHPKVNPSPDGFQAPFVAPQDVTLSNVTFSMNDPWLPPNSTETLGNNVDAYANLINGTSPSYSAGTDNGYGPLAPAPYDGVKTVANGGGDFRGQITAPGVFNRTPTANTVPTTAEQRLGAIQQLFYNINFLHDWFYDSGFTEAARNAQTDNFGRGGLGNDSIKAQAQDIQGRNNANMLTPADGSRPRMRMYVFDTVAPKYLQVTSPASTAGKRGVGTFQSGPQSFDVTNTIVYAAPTNACTALTNAAAVAGKTVMVQYPSTLPAGCSIGSMILNAQNAGATEFLLVWLQSSPTQAVNVTGVSPAYTIPFLSISFNNAATIKTALANNETVTARFRRDPGIERDGTVDNQIVAHEWGHYLSGRLVGNGAGLNTQQSGGMGEGWGDFTAMMLTVRAEDTATPSNATWNGVYAIATYTQSGGLDGDPVDGNQGYYYGIRRVPYSTDMAKNGLTFRHISDGQALPGGILSGAPNSQVHNTGEVWSTMLWECYAALLRDTQGANPRLTFLQAQDRMKLYLVTSLSLTPNSPTFVEARDAVLAAAYATDAADYQLFLRAFAKRGAGMNAVAPDRYSVNHAGVVESFDVLPEISFAGITLDDSVTSCDSDGNLDSGDAGKLTVKIKNIGSQTLTGTVGSVSSTTPGITFPNGNTITFPPSDPLDTVTGSLTVAFAGGISGIQQLDFQVDVYDPAIGSPRTQFPGFRGNVTSIPAASATDTVEGFTTPWSLDSDATLSQVNPWTRTIVLPLDREWHIDNPSAASDQRLVSPVFTVDGSGSVNVQFDHSWSFEWDSSGNYDGGVVEMQVNGGAWTDIGTAAYNGTLINYTGNVNPLKTRAAFVKTGNSHTSLTQAIAPGSTVRIRFRFGSDSAAGAAGWNIDNIAFSGVVETPFAVAAGDPGCAVVTTTVLTTSANPSNFGSALTLTATVTSPSTTPTGTVSFYDGAALLATVPLTSGVATTSVSNLTVGAHSLKAVYSGGTGFAASSSAAFAQTITKTATTVALTSSANPSNIGAAVTFTATVTATSGTPTGSVTFSQGATTLGSAAMTAGVATFTTSALAGGNQTITATYAGTATFASSSNSLTQNVITGSTIAFAPTAYSKFENAGTIILTVTRTGGDTTGSASVQFATASGTALSGTNFNADSGTVTFAAGETSKTIAITLLNAATIDGKRTFTVNLSNPNAAVLGAAVATVDVMDDDTGRTDFSAPLDGKNDIVWRNESTGDTKVHRMNGTTFLSSADLLQFGGNWRYAAAADFNADGNADLLFRHAVDGSLVVWYMSGTNILGTSPVISSPDLNWKLAAVGDVTGDGYPDMVWRHATTFTNAVWVMRNNVRLSIYTLPTIADANWQIKGLGDFNRDGQLDLVWRHTANGTVAVWHLAIGGMSRTTIAAIAPTVGAPWELVGVADMNSDGDADLLWQASTTRTVAIWLMSQTTRSSILTTPTINDANWSVVGPR